MFNNNLNNKAVSLIEIIVTITIAFLLSAISIYSYQDYRIKALVNSAITIAEQNKLAVSNFYVANKICPPPNFVNQTIKSNSYIKTISNDDPSSRCIVNLKDASGNTLMYFKAMLSATTGELKYFCLLGSTPVPNKYLSITCPDPIDPNFSVLPTNS